MSDDRTIRGIGQPW